MKKYDVHLCPEVHGRVTFKGQPLSGITIIRDINYGESYIDKTQTDANGEFHFPEWNIQSHLPGNLFTQETRVIQHVYFKMNKKFIYLWGAPQRGTKPNQALSQRLALLKCEVTDKRADFYFPSAEHPEFYHTAVSVCRWPYGLGPNERPKTPEGYGVDMSEK